MWTISRLLQAFAQNPGGDSVSWNLCQKKKLFLQKWVNLSTGWKQWPGMFKRLILLFKLTTQMIILNSQ